jgi:hypothetical protein
VLVTRDGEARVLDFGLAGTPAYISPEQLRAEESGPASDQFSFCVALHEALLGVHPFEFHSLATLEAALAAGARSPRPRGVAVPAWLLAVIERGLAIDPRARWPTMDALLAALQGDPLHRRRRRVALAGVGLLAVGVAIGAHQVEARAVARCEAAGAVVEASWSPAARAGLADAFARTGAPNAAETWDRFAAQLDGWSADWRAARADACLAARDEPGPGRLRERCLDRQRWQLDALLAVFSAVDAAMVQRAVNAAASLPPVARCGEPGWLAAERGLAEPDAAEDTLRQQLVRVFVLEGVGQQGEALAVAEASVDAAVKLGDASLEAEARRNLGGMRWRSGDLEGAEASLRAAYFLAGGSGHDPRRARGRRGADARRRGRPCPLPRGPRVGGARAHGPAPHGPRPRARRPAAASGARAAPRRGGRPTPRRWPRTAGRWSCCARARTPATPTSRSP